MTFAWCDLERTYGFEALLALVAEQPEGAPKEPRRVYVPAGLPQTLGEYAAVPRLPIHRAIDEYNAATELRELLLGYGYADAGAGRMNRPGGDSAGVQLHSDNTASIYSSADPLWCGHRITPAHALCVWVYEGDVQAMLAELGGRQEALPAAARREAVLFPPAPAIQQLPLPLAAPCGR